MKIDEAKKRIENDSMLIETLFEWVIIEHDGRSVSRLVRDMGYHKIGIYGNGYLGRLFQRIVDREILDIVCVIDRLFDGRDGFHISLKNELPGMDVIIVTSLYYYEEIRREILNFYPNIEVRSIDEFIWQL